MRLQTDGIPCALHSACGLMPPCVNKYPETESCRVFRDYYPSDLHLGLKAQVAIEFHYRRRIIIFTPHCNGSRARNIGRRQQRQWMVSCQVGWASVPRIITVDRSLVCCRARGVSRSIPASPSTAAGSAIEIIRL